MTAEYEIVSAGADVEQGPSLLRWTDGLEFYIAFIEANGVWYSQTLLPGNMPELPEGARFARAVGYCRKR